MSIALSHQSSIVKWTDFRLAKAPPLWLRIAVILQPIWNHTLTLTVRMIFSLHQISKLSYCQCLAGSSAVLSMEAASAQGAAVLAMHPHCQACRSRFRVCAIQMWKRTVILRTELKSYPLAEIERSVALWSSLMISSTPSWKIS